MAYTGLSAVWGAALGGSMSGKCSTPSGWYPGCEWVGEPEVAACGGEVVRVGVDIGRDWDWRGTDGNRATGEDILKSTKKKL